MVRYWEVKRGFRYIFIIIYFLVVLKSSLEFLCWINYNLIFNY